MTKKSSTIELQNKSEREYHLHDGQVFGPGQVGVFPAEYGTMLKGMYKSELVDLAEKSQEFSGPPTEFTAPVQAIDPIVLNRQEQTLRQDAELQKALEESIKISQKAADDKAVLEQQLKEAHERTAAAEQSAAEAHTARVEAEKKAEAASKK